MKTKFGFRVPERRINRAQLDTRTMRDSLSPQRSAGREFPEKLESNLAAKFAADFNVKRHFAHRVTEPQPKGTLKYAARLFYRRTMEASALGSNSPPRFLPVLDEGDRG